MANPQSDSRLRELYDLIDGIEVAMFTTRRPDGQLVSRPMATQRRTAGTDLWFVTDWDTHKLEELAFDPHVNVAYYRPRTGEWVSVSGTAIVSRDRQLVHGLYEPSWRAWFGDQGGDRTGGPDDPRIVLILVEAESVTYLKQDKPMPVVLFEAVKGMITGNRARPGDLREISERELPIPPHEDAPGADLR